MTPHFVETSGTCLIPSTQMYEGRLRCGCGASFESCEPTRQAAIDRVRTEYLLHKGTS